MKRRICVRTLFQALFHPANLSGFHWDLNHQFGKVFFEKPLLVAQQTTQGPVVGENYGPVSFFFVFSGEWIDFYGVHGSIS